jgi:hypothetical protein
MSEDKRRTDTKARGKKAVSTKGARRRSRSGTENTPGVHRAGGRPEAVRYNNGLSITVQIPSIRRRKPVGPLERPALARIIGYRNFIVPVVGLVLITVIVGLQHKPAHVAAPQPTVAAQRTKADFEVLTPKAEQAAATKYDGKRNLATYTTTFSGVRLTVSQQPLPAHFKTDKLALKKVADSTNAKQLMDTKHGPLYVATNQEAGDQLALFAADKVLLMIHTDRAMDEASWKSFIEQLKGM